MRFLAECQWQDKVFEIDTDRDETTPQALHSALVKVDPMASEYSKVLTSLTGRNRTVIVTQNEQGSIRIEVYLRRSGLIG